MALQYYHRFDMTFLGNMNSQPNFGRAANFSSGLKD